MAQTAAPRDHQRTSGKERRTRTNCCLILTDGAVDRRIGEGLVSTVVQKKFSERSTAGPVNWARTKISKEGGRQSRIVYISVDHEWNGHSTRRNLGLSGDKERYTERSKNGMKRVREEMEGKTIIIRVRI